MEPGAPGRGAGAGPGAGGAFERFLTSAIATILTIIFSWRYLLDEDRSGHQLSLQYTHPVTGNYGPIKRGSGHKDLDKEEDVNSKYSVVEVDEDNVNYEQHHNSGTIGILGTRSNITPTPYGEAACESGSSDSYHGRQPGSRTVTGGRHAIPYSTDYSQLTASFHRGNNAASDANTATTWSPRNTASDATSDAKPNATSAMYPVSPGRYHAGIRIIPLRGTCDGIKARAQVGLPPAAEAEPPASAITDDEQFPAELGHQVSLRLIQAAVHDADNARDATNTLQSMTSDGNPLQMAAFPQPIPPDRRPARCRGDKANGVDDVDSEASDDDNDDDVDSSSSDVSGIQCLVNESSNISKETSEAKAKDSDSDSDPCGQEAYLSGEEREYSLGDPLGDDSSESEYCVIFKRVLEAITEENTEDIETDNNTDTDFQDIPADDENEDVHTQPYRPQMATHMVAIGNGTLDVGSSKTSNRAMDSDGGDLRSRSNGEKPREMDWTWPTAAMPSVNPLLHQANFSQNPSSDLKSHLSAGEFSGDPDAYIMDTGSDSTLPGGVRSQSGSRDHSDAELTSETDTNSIDVSVDVGPEQLRDAERARRYGGLINTGRHLIIGPYRDRHSEFSRQSYIAFPKPELREQQQQQQQQQQQALTAGELEADVNMPSTHKQSSHHTHPRHNQEYEEQPKYPDIASIRYLPYHTVDDKGTRAHPGDIRGNQNTTSHPVSIESEHASMQAADHPQPVLSIKHDTGNSYACDIPTGIGPSTDDTDMEFRRAEEWSMATVMTSSPGWLGRSGSESSPRSSDTLEPGGGNWKTTSTDDTETSELSTNPRIDLYDPQLGIYDPKGCPHGPQLGLYDPQLGLYDPQLGLYDATRRANRTGSSEYESVDGKLKARHMVSEETAGDVWQSTGETGRTWERSIGETTSVNKRPLNVFPSSMPPETSPLCEEGNVNQSDTDGVHDTRRYPIQQPSLSPPCLHCQHGADPAAVHKPMISMERQVPLTMYTQTSSEHTHIFGPMDSAGEQAGNGRSLLKGLTPGNPVHAYYTNDGGAQDQNDPVDGLSSQSRSHQGNQVRLGGNSTLEHAANIAPTERINGSNSSRVQGLSQTSSWQSGRPHGTRVTLRQTEVERHDEVSLDVGSRGLEHGQSAPANTPQSALPEQQQEPELQHSTRCYWDTNIAPAYIAPTDADHVTIGHFRNEYTSQNTDAQQTKGDDRTGNYVASTPTRHGITSGNIKVSGGQIVWSGAQSHLCDDSVNMGRDNTSEHTQVVEASPDGLPRYNDTYNDFVIESGPEILPKYSDATLSTSGEGKLSGFTFVKTTPIETEFSFRVRCETGVTQGSPGDSGGRSPDRSDQRVGQKVQAVICDASENTAEYTGYAGMRTDADTVSYYTYRTGMDSSNTHHSNTHQDISGNNSAVNSTFTAGDRMGSECKMGECSRRDYTGHIYYVTPGLSKGGDTVTTVAMSPPTPRGHVYRETGGADRAAPLISTHGSGDRYRYVMGNHDDEPTPGESRVGVHPDNPPVAAPPSGAPPADHHRQDASLSLSLEVCRRGDVDGRYTSTNPTTSRTVPDGATELPHSPTDIIQTGELTPQGVQSERCHPPNMASSTRDNQPARYSRPSYETSRNTRSYVPSSGGYGLREEYHDNDEHFLSTSEFTTGEDGTRDKGRYVDREARTEQPYWQHDYLSEHYEPRRSRDLQTRSGREPTRNEVHGSPPWRSEHYPPNLHKGLSSGGSLPSPQVLSERDMSVERYDDGCHIMRDVAAQNDDVTTPRRSCTALATSTALARTNDGNADQMSRDVGVYNSRSVVSAVGNAEATGENPYIAVARATARAATLASAHATAGAAKLPEQLGPPSDINVVVSTSCTIRNDCDAHIMKDSNDVINAVGSSSPLHPPPRNRRIISNVGHSSVGPPRQAIERIDSLDIPKRMSITIEQDRKGGRQKETRSIECELPGDMDDADLTSVIRDAVKTILMSQSTPQRGPLPSDKHLDDVIDRVTRQVVHAYSTDQDTDDDTRHQKSIQEAPKMYYPRGFKDRPHSLPPPPPARRTRIDRDTYREMHMLNRHPSDDSDDLGRYAIPKNNQKAKRTPKPRGDSTLFYVTGTGPTLGPTTGLVDDVILKVISDDQMKPNIEHIMLSETESGSEAGTPLLPRKAAEAYGHGTMPPVTSRRRAWSPHSPLLNKEPDDKVDSEASVKEQKGCDQREIKGILRSKPRSGEVSPAYVVPGNDTYKQQNRWSRPHSRPDETIQPEDPDDMSRGRNSACEDTSANRTSSGCGGTPVGLNTKSAKKEKKPYESVLLTPITDTRTPLSITKKYDVASNEQPESGSITDQGYLIADLKNPPWPKNTVLDAAFEEKKRRWFEMSPKRDPGLVLVDIDINQKSFENESRLPGAQSTEELKRKLSNTRLKAPSSNIEQKWQTVTALKPYKSHGNIFDERSMTDHQSKKRTDSVSSTPSDVRRAKSLGTLPSQFFADRRSFTSLLETDIDTGLQTQTPLIYETDLDEIRPPKTRSLINLTSGTDLVAVNFDDERHKSMENVSSNLYSLPGNGGTCDQYSEAESSDTQEKSLSAHELRITQSLNKLSIPDWYRSSFGKGKKTIELSNTRNIREGRNIVTAGFRSETPSKESSISRPVIIHHRVTTPVKKSPCSSAASTPTDATPPFQLPSTKLRQTQKDSKTLEIKAPDLPPRPPVQRKESAKDAYLRLKSQSQAQWDSLRWPLQPVMPLVPGQESSSDRDHGIQPPPDPNDRYVTQTYLSLSPSADPADNQPSRITTRVGSQGHAPGVGQTASDRSSTAPQPYQPGATCSDLIDSMKLDPVNPQRELPDPDEVYTKMLTNLEDAGRQIRERTKQIVSDSDKSFPVRKEEFDDIRISRECFPILSYGSSPTSRRKSPDQSGEESDLHQKHIQLKLTKADIHHRSEHDYRYSHGNDCHSGHSLDEVIGGLLAIPDGDQGDGCQENPDENELGSPKARVFHLLRNADTPRGSMVSVNTNKGSEAASEEDEGSKEEQSQHFSLAQLSPSYEGRDIITEETVIVRCRNSKCKKMTDLSNARKSYKTCHNCFTYYCSRECRKAHWERHKRTCLFSRVNSSCKHVIKTIHDVPELLEEVTRVARTGFLSKGRGCVLIAFSSPENAEEFLKKNSVGHLETPPGYANLNELHEFENLFGDHFFELVEICKTYNPELKFVIEVAIVAGQEVPAWPVPRREGPAIKKCARLRLASAQPKRSLPPRGDPETLILTAIPGSEFTENMEEKKAREICFINIQRKLRQRGVSLRHHFPEVYGHLCAYVAQKAHFTPITIYPIDANTGKRFMCLIMPNSEPEVDWMYNPDLLNELGLATQV